MKKMLFVALAFGVMSTGTVARTPVLWQAAPGPDVNWRPSRQLPMTEFPATPLNAALAVDVEGNAHILQRVQGVVGLNYSIHYTNTRLEARESNGFQAPAHIDNHGGAPGKSVDEPDIFIGSNDMAHIVWTRGDSDGNNSWADLRYARINFQGGIVGSVENVTTAVANEYFSKPQIVVSDTGTIHIVLIHEPPMGVDPQIRHFSKAPGGAWTNTFIANQRNPRNLRVGFRAGQLCAVWDDWSGTEHGIYYSIRDLAQGGPWSAKSQLAGGNDSEPDVDVDTQGIPHFVWRTDGGGVSYSKNGAGGPAVTTSSSAFAPHIRVGSGWIHVVYAFNGFAHSWKHDSAGTWDHRQPIDPTPNFADVRDLALANNTDLHTVSIKHYKRSRSTPPDGTSLVPVFPGASVNIVPLNGSLRYRLPLFSSNGVGPALSLGLSYDSKEIASNHLGPGWTMDHLMHVGSDGEDGVILTLPNGLRFAFTPGAGGNFGLADIGFGFVAQLKKVATGWELHSGGSIYAFNAGGKLSSIIEPTGLAMTVSYSAGRPSGIADMLWGGGRFTTFEYVGDRMSAVVDPAGGRYTFGYTNGRLSSVTFAGDPSSPTYSFEYNISGAIKKVTKPEGGAYSIFYDSAGRVERIDDPEEMIAAGFGAAPALTTAAFHVAYNNNVTFMNAGKFHTQVTNRRGASSVYVFDAANKFGVKEFWDPTALAGSNALPLLRTYDQFGNTLTLRDRLGAMTTFTYVPPVQAPALWLTNLVQTSTRELSSTQSLVESYTYDNSNDMGNVETHTVQVTPTGAGAPVSRVTTFHYDAFGRLTETLFPDVTRPDGVEQLGVKTVNVYNPVSPFQLIQTKDEENRTTTLTAFHPVHGLPTSSLREGGTQPFEMQYDLMGNLTGTKAPKGGDQNDTPGWNYMDRDGLYRVWRLRDPLGHATIHQFDRESRPTTTQPPAGGPTTIQYDLRGFVKGSSSPDGTWSQFVDGNGNITLKTSMRLATTERDYDLLDRLTETRAPGAGFVGGGGPVMTTRTLYDQVQAGERYTRQIQVGIPPNADRVTDSFMDLSGRVVRTAAADGNTVVHTFFDEKSQVVATNAYFNGVFQTSTVSFRDARDRIDRMRIQDVPYPTAIGPTHRTSETITLYNRTGATVEVRDPLRQAGQPGHMKTNVLDVRHRVQFVLDGFGQTVQENVWGDDDLLIETKIPDPATKSGTLVRAEFRTYTARKELKRTENRAGFGLSNVYNSIHGQIQTVTDAAGRVTRTTYHPATQRVDEVIMVDGLTAMERRTRSIWDAGLLTETQVFNPQTGQQYGSSYRYFYDRADRLEKVEAPLISPEICSYDEFGDEKTLGLGGKTLTHQHNALGQRISTTWSGTHTGSEIRTYNGIGQVESVTSPTHSKSLLYDVWLGTPAVEVFQVGGQTWKTQTHASDVAKNYTHLLDAANGNHEWVYDENNRVKETKFQNQTTSLTFYTPGGLVDRTELKNASGATIVETLHLYDGRCRKVRQVSTNPATQEVVSGFEWGYDDLDLVRLISVDHLGVKGDINYNERREVVEEIWSGNAGGAGMPPYTNQIGGAGGQESAGSSPVAQGTPNSKPAVQGVTKRYGFDRAGNRTFTEIDNVTTTYTYNAAGQLTFEDGPTTDVSYLYDEWGNETTRNTSGATSLTEIYSYNHLNLLSVYTRNSVISGQYDYWPTGERYSKITAAGTELYIPRNGDVAAEYSNAATLKNVYVQGIGTDQKQIRIAAGADGIINAGDERRHYFGDKVGTVSVVLTDTGAVAESHLKDVWGMPITQTSTQERYGFAQRERDTESGLVHMRARQYDPRTGRFTQNDPLLANRPFEGYQYCRNNPVAMIDPLGLDIWDDILENAMHAMKNLAMRYAYETDPERRRLYAQFYEKQYEIAQEAIGRAGTANKHSATLSKLDPRLGMNQVDRQLHGAEEWVEARDNAVKVTATVTAAAAKIYLGVVAGGGGEVAFFVDDVRKGEAGVMSVFSLPGVNVFLAKGIADLADALGKVQGVGKITFRTGKSTKVFEGSVEDLKLLANVLQSKEFAATANRIEGMIKTGVAKAGWIPKMPGIMKTTEFGNSIMKWGSGTMTARARIGNVTRAEMQAAGVTREMALDWRDFYVNEYIRTNGANKSAAGRAELMDHVAELLK